MKTINKHDGNDLFLAIASHYNQFPRTELIYFHGIVATLYSSTWKDIK